MARRDVFKALADPTRRQILRMLNRRLEMSAGEIAGAFDMSAPSISHHFNVLKEADLISQRRDRQQILYSLNTTVVEDLLTLMLGMFGKSRQEGRRKR
jgi:ArsR family transcriptional regulator, arsenate/arsenite/antimonite-responsive transcriptional repressor